MTTPDGTPDCTPDGTPYCTTDGTTDYTQGRQLQQWGNCSPSSSLLSRFITLPCFWLPEGRLPAEEDELKHSMHEELRHFSIEFYTTDVERLTQRCKKCVNNGGDYVEKIISTF
jgi:hypothetical protein